MNWQKKWADIKKLFENYALFLKQFTQSDCNYRKNILLLHYLIPSHDISYKIKPICYPHKTMAAKLFSPKSLFPPHTKTATSGENRKSGLTDKRKTVAVSLEEQEKTRPVKGRSKTNNDILCSSLLHDKLLTILLLNTKEYLTWTFFLILWTWSAFLLIANESRSYFRCEGYHQSTLEWRREKRERQQHV